MPLLEVHTVDTSTVGLDSGPTSSPVEGKRSPSTPRPVAAVVIGDQYIGPRSADSVPLRLRDPPPDSVVLSLLDSMKVGRLSLESTFSSVDAHHVTHALVCNASGAPITLKQGILLGNFEVFDSSPLEEPSPFPVACVSCLGTLWCNGSALGSQPRGSEVHPRAEWKNLGGFSDTHTPLFT